MANSNVRSCRLEWTICSASCDPFMVSPYFSAIDDVNLRWFFRFGCTATAQPVVKARRKIKVPRYPRFDKWYVTLFVSNAIDAIDNHEDDLDRDETYDENQSDQGSVIAGEAILKIKLKPCNSSNESYDEDKRSFVQSKEDFFVDSGFIFRHKISQSHSIPYDDDFNVTLMCEVSYSHMIIKDTVEILCPPVSTKSVFEEMYLNKEYSDVVLCVNGTDHYAHKMVLAAHSKVFKAMFSHDVQENKLNRVQVDDINETAFLKALRFMYTGKVEDVQTLATDLLPIADRYDIDRLKALCCSVLHSKLEVKTVVKTVLLADWYNVDDLRARAIEFITNHSKDVLLAMNPEEKKEIASRPNLMIDLFDVLMQK